MKYATTIIILGIITAAIPYLGFPFSWKKIIFVALGVIIFIIGLLARHDRRKYSPAESKKEGLAFKDSDYTKVEITIPEEN